MTDSTRKEIAEARADLDRWGKMMDAYQETGDDAALVDGDYQFTFDSPSQSASTKLTSSSTTTPTPKPS